MEIASKYITPGPNIPKFAIKTMVKAYIIAATKALRKSIFKCLFKAINEIITAHAKLKMTVKTFPSFKPL